MPTKSVNMKNSKNKIASLSHVLRITRPKNEVPRSKSVLSSLITYRQTHTKVNTEDTLSGFHVFFLQPIMKERSNYTYYWIIET